MMMAKTKRRTSPRLPHVSSSYHPKCGAGEEKRGANKIACVLGEESQVDGYIQRLAPVPRRLRLVEVGVCETAGGMMMVMAMEVKCVCSWVFFGLALACFDFDHTSIGFSSCEYISSSLSFISIYIYILYTAPSLLREGCGQPILQHLLPPCAIGTAAAAAGQSPLALHHHFLPWGRVSMGRFPKIKYRPSSHATSWSSA